MNLILSIFIRFQGVASALNRAGFLVNYPLVQLTNLMGSKPLLNLTVYDYLWGYDDPLVRLASGIVPKFINFRKFGLLDRVSIFFINLHSTLNVKCIFTFQS